MPNPDKIYQALLKKYSHQGWWPTIENKELVYHIKDYSFPKTKAQEFEVCTGVMSRCLTKTTPFKVWLHLEHERIAFASCNSLCRKFQNLSGIFMHPKDECFFKPRLLSHGSTSSF